MYSIIGSWWCVLTYTPVRFQNAIYGLLKPAGGVMQIIIKTYNVNWASVHSSHTALDTPTPVPKDSYSTLACWSSKAYIYVCVHLLPMILNVTFSRQGRCFTRSSSIHISRTFRLLCTTWQKPKLRSCCCCACIPGCRNLIWKKMLIRISIYKAIDGRPTWKWKMWVYFFQIRIFCNIIVNSTHCDQISWWWTGIYRA